MNRKRILSMGLACIMAAAMSVTAFAESKIFVDLQEVQTDTPPQIVNDRTMVPVRAITDRKSTRLNSSHSGQSRMPSSA